MTIVTRKGNPKNIKTWDDLLKPGIEVVTPNPFSSGSAKWNLLAPYAEKSDGGKNPDAGLDYLSKLIGDHVKVQPKSGREATETFLQGTGDVLLSYENEAIFATRQGEDVDYVDAGHHVQDREPGGRAEQQPRTRSRPRRSSTSSTRPRASAVWAEAGFRPVDPTVAEEFASDFPEPKQLWTIDDLGGWSKVNDEFFDEENGSVAKIYEEATG